MSAQQSYDARTVKGMKAGVNPPSLVNPGHSGPTTFFLRSERDIEKSTPRGRKVSRSSADTQDERLRTPSASTMGDSRFGVESLSDTISSAFPSDSSLSRTNSNSTEGGALEASIEGGTLTGRKRKAGNPVHPSILATGQRIISAERTPLSAASPLSFRSSESPYRSHLRRGSATSSLNLNSQPLTPLRMSPQPDSAMPSTPRSGSPKSFRLSDEEGSMADETGSQAVQSSSSGEEDEEVHAGESENSSMPQLVMPSISVPARRPFTDRGKRMGRLKVMVVGQRGVGKTSLIQSIFRSCEDIVHVDPTSGNQMSLPRRGIDYDLTPGITEFYASTRSYPRWWTDFEGRRMLHRRKSIGEGVLERNLCFIDTPAADDEASARQILEYFTGAMQRTASLEKMTDSEVVSVLSGEGGVQIDVVLWVFAASSLPGSDERLEGKERELFETLCRCTNVVPVIGHADNVPAGDIDVRKQQVGDMIGECGQETFALSDAAVAPGSKDEQQYITPFAISSALSDDAETIDASILMSSQYMQPLVPSELGYLIEHLLDPENIARMRHISATKFLLLRQQNLGHRLVDLQKQTLLHRSPQFGHTLPSITDTGSLLEEPSKVLVPHGSSSYFRSASPYALSETSAGGGAAATSATLAHYNEAPHAPGSDTAPFRQVRLAKWARDLQRGLENERRRYQYKYFPQQQQQPPAADWDLRAETTAEEGHHNDNEKAVIHASAGEKHTSPRPSRGRLGGDIAVIDPRDPLGVLALAQRFRRQGWLALRVAGGCGLLGAMAWWVLRNWAEVQREWLGVGVGAGEVEGMRRMAAVPPPPPPPAMRTPLVEGGLMGWVGEVDWRGFFGWER
ncbi:hypothetical protein B0A55_08950 [Friedmanniomyces simplex]|uniref:Septin-type G domain-containing protein n=1 Tax=Friedmanniomyces simplex TaxID=329884 RepID=A0A4U0X2Z9_9PEZI|nr:hypothetical protein B0A55_08950 [Friedmanniomyces simplex]